MMISNCKLIRSAWVVMGKMGVEQKLIPLNVKKANNVIRDMANPIASIRWVSHMYSP